MKVFLSFIFIFTLNLIVAQKSELGVSYCIGLSTKDIFRPGSNKLNDTDTNLNRGLVFLNNQSYEINYKHQISSRYNLWLISDLGFAITEYYRPIFSEELCLESVRINQKRLDFSLGILKKIFVYDSLVEFEAGIQFRFPVFFNKVNEISTDTKPYSSFPNWIHYDYDIEINNGSYFESDAKITRFNRLFSPKLVFNSGYNLTRNLKLNLGLSFTTNVYLFYDYQYNVYYYSNGTPDIYKEYHFSGTQSATRKFGAKSSFFSINFGLSYKF